jgi:GAF domain-containing protein/HAMP domain-containing protein
MSAHTRTPMTSDRFGRIAGISEGALRRVSWVLAGILAVGLIFTLAAYFTGGTWHLLVAAVGSGAALLGMCFILLRTRVDQEPAHTRAMAYLLMGLFILDLLVYVLVFSGIGLYLLGGGVLALILVGIVLLHRQWAATGAIASLFLVLASLIEWLEPLPRYDLSLDSTAAFAAPLVFLLLLLGLVFLAVRSAVLLSIRGRLLISFALVALLPGILIAGASLVVDLQASEQGILAELEASADENEARVLAWLEEVHLDVMVFRELEYADLRTLLTAERDSPEFDAAQTEQQRRFRDWSALRGSIDLLYLVDPTGGIVLSSLPDDIVRQTVSDEGLAGILAATSRGTHVQPLESGLSGRLTFVVAVPIFDETEGLRGVLVGQTGLDQLAAIMAEHRGARGIDTMYLVDSQGRALTGTDILHLTGSQGVEALLITRDRHSGRYLDHRGEVVWGEYRWVSGLELGLVAEAQPGAQGRTAWAANRLNIILTGISVGLAIVGAAVVANGIARPLVEMAEVATAVAAGDLTRRISMDLDPDPADRVVADRVTANQLPLDRVDEVGRMALAFNEMSRRLQELVGSLEERVALRTQELERRSAQLQTAADVARLAASIRGIDELLRVAAAQIGERFGFYHVGIYLRDDARRALVLRAASSATGLLARGFRLELVAASEHTDYQKSRGIVVDVARSGKPSIVQDVSQDARYLTLAELPDTRSEMSLPLRVRGEVIGVLDVQSTEFGAFSADDTAYLSTLADQLSLAIENARLFAEAEQRLRGLHGLVQAQRQEGWREMLAGDGRWAYTYDGVEARRVDESDRMGSLPDLELPLGSASGQESDRLGVVRVRLGAGRDLAEADVELARAVVAEAAQALERARLFGGTQRALLEADTLYRCGRAIVGASNVDEVVAALAEYVVAPGIDRLAVLTTRPGPSDRHPIIEVASSWTDATDGKGSGIVPGLRVGERLETGRLPVLASLTGESDGADDCRVIKDVVVSDDLDEASREMLLHTLGLRAVVVLPLRSGAEVMGWLLIGAGAGPYAFSAQEIRMYQGLADQVAPVLRSFELLERTARRAERERSIGAIGETIRGFTDVETILEISMRELGRVLGANEGVIRLHPQKFAQAAVLPGSAAGIAESGNGAGMDKCELDGTVEELDV